MMFQIQLNRSVLLTFFITVLAIALAIQKCCCAGSLVTTPPTVDGVLTSCGETRLTCSHDNVVGEQTRWSITAMNSSEVCTLIIPHTSPSLATLYRCNEFSFEDITALPGAVDALNSTAVVNPLPLGLSGSRIECVAGALSTSPSVGNVTLCVIDRHSPPMNIRSVPLPNNLTSVVLEWDAQSTCTRDTVSYTIAIDGVAVPTGSINDTSYIVSGLEANRMYTASVRTLISNCMSDQSNVTFEIMAKTPTPVVDAHRFFCANSSDSITLAFSWMFPSRAPVGVVYPPTSELTITVLVSDSIGLVSNTTFPASQSDAFFNLGINESFTLSVKAYHATTGSSTPTTIPLSTVIHTVDATATLQDDCVSVRLNEGCVENPTAFTSTLSYGSCPNSVTFQETQPFSSSSTAVFMVNLSAVTGDQLCIRVVVSHQSQPNRPLNTLERQFTLSSCPVAPINSVASSGVAVEFSLAESSGEVPHGTIATFKPLSVCTDRLVGAEHATCVNGEWSDLSQRASSSPLSTSEAVAIAVVLTMISTLIVGVISTFLVTYCIMKRRAPEHLAADDQPRGTLYEEVSQPKTSEQTFEMGDNVAYGPVRH